VADMIMIVCVSLVSESKVETRLWCFVWLKRRRERAFKPTRAEFGYDSIGDHIWCFPYAFMSHHSLSHQMLSNLNTCFSTKTIQPTRYF